jgi:sugar phosphate isomerase/epimerase
MTQKQLYVSTACIKKKEQLLGRIFRYQNAGIHHIELGASVILKDNFDPLRLPNQNTSYLIHNYFPPPEKSFVLNLASDNKEIRNLSIRLVKRALEISSQIGANRYSVHAGFVTDPIGFGSSSFIFPNPESESDVIEARNRFYKSLSEILKVCRKLQIKLLVENNVCTKELMGKLLLLTAADVEDMFRNIQDENLGILIDTGHLKVTSNTLDFDPANFVERIGQYIGLIHLHDNDGYEDQHLPLKENNWMFDILRMPIFSFVPIVVEAQFISVNDIASYLKWLDLELN